MNVDSSCKKLTCFMLDGKCAWSGDAGGSWTAFADVGRNWDYAAVDWSGDAVKTIFTALLESGGQVMLSNDGGKTWNKLFKDAEFDKSDGLGVFDDKTLLYAQKGKGIQRSTDVGRTWGKISDREPIGRVVLNLTEVCIAISQSCFNARSAASVGSRRTSRSGGNRQAKQSGRRSIRSE